MDAVNITIFDIATLVLSIKTLIISIFLIRILKSHKRILRRSCGIHLEAILYFTFLAALTAVPTVGFLFYYGNINCPEMALSIISIPRIFTFRFEVTQFTCLGIDRVITTLLTNGYQRRVRNISFGITIGLSVFLAVTDVIIYLIRDKFRQYSPQCGLGSGAGPFYAGYFFLLNFLCFSLVFACFIFHAYDTISHPSSSSVTARFLNQQVNNFLFIFIITFGLPTILLTIYRLFHFDAFKSIINYTDASMQLQHVFIILSFLFCLNSKRKHLKQVSTTTTSTFTSVQPPPKNNNNNNLIPLQPQINNASSSSTSPDSNLTNNLPGSIS